MIIMEKKKYNSEIMILFILCLQIVFINNFSLINHIYNKQ